ncbi:hypothetical protein Q4Q34_03640 [Flavivirga abyssicola]|uniref:hypothetical protein n=1 Tax=Flavivirga abyssicola TaxID=3063533 RepID=UPI0026DFCFFB|nr:hypothetical protein [Flavivirga sp. MEBiC07777]WVK14121.1 hypothetical protein Q4Q34_03640 [Flavivirga sp. MEBiC07777]
MLIFTNFDIKRYYNALKYDLILNGKKYVLFIAGLFVLLLIVDLIFIMDSYNEMGLYNGLIPEYKKQYNPNRYNKMFFITYMICALFAIGTAFPYLRNRKNASHYLMLPISVLEKFLIEFSIRIFGFSIIFIVLFWLGFKVAEIIFNMIDLSMPFEIRNFNLFHPFTYIAKSSDKVFVTLSLLSYATFLFAGASHFQKNAFFKTVLSLGLLSLLAYMFSLVLSYIFIPNEVSGFEVKILSRKLDSGMLNIQLYFYIIGVFSSLFLLPYAYFKLKEKEI